MRKELVLLATARQDLGTCASPSQCRLLDFGTSRVSQVVRANGACFAVVVEVKRMATASVLPLVAMTRQDLSRSHP